MMDNDPKNDVGANEGIEEEAAWGADPLNTSEGPLDITDPLDISEGLLDISQDPAVLACGNVLPGEEVEYLSGHCLPNLLPPSAPPMIDGMQATADIKQEMNLVEVVYEAGFCLPRLIVKEEAQEVMKKELDHTGETFQSGNISGNSMNAEEVLSASTQDLTMMMAAMKAKQGILNMANMADMMQEEQGEVSTKELMDEGAELGASLPVEIGGAMLPGGAEFPDGAGFSGGAKFPGSAELMGGVKFGEGFELGASVPGGDMNKFMGVVDELGSSCSAGIDVGENLPERSIVLEPFGAELAASIELGASCTSGDINTLLSQIESMGLQG